MTDMCPYMCVLICTSLYVRAALGGADYMYVLICTSLYVCPCMYTQHLAGLNAYDREQERIKMQKLAELAKM